MDATTRQVIAFHVGDRSGQSAEALWEKIPAAYQEHAMFYTDHYAAYSGVIPSPNTVPSLNWPARLIMSNGLTARYGNASRGWYVRRYRSPKSSAITSGPSSISSVITTSPDVQHYQNSTTCYRGHSRGGARSDQTCDSCTPTPVQSLPPLCCHCRLPQEIPCQTLGQAKARTVGDMHPEEGGKNSLFTNRGSRVELGERGLD